jgi:modification methylase
MKTRHKLVIADARSMADIPAESVDLVVTSPPYPMIQMWDELFSDLSADAKNALEREDGNSAFEAMHVELDRVWQELFRILKPGTFACVNVGDATRSIAGRFQLYPNHSRITEAFRSFGFDTLPVILWRKQTNAPNKFMGSGMLPAGAYVTLEHEYILVFRKGPKKQFKSPADKRARMQSSFFWEERNIWFSDVWDFKGTTQKLDRADLRVRSAAFPLELVYRLVNMYSLYGDTVLDPFMGTGTTALAAIACARNSIGVELDQAFAPLVSEQVRSAMTIANDLLASRVRAHEEFIAAYTAAKGGTKHRNECHGFPVVTRQETKIQFYKLDGVKTDTGLISHATYEPLANLVDAGLPLNRSSTAASVQSLQQTLPL